MVMFHSRFSIQHGPPLSYLHGKNLENKNKIDAGSNSKNIVNSASVFNDIDYVHNKYKGIMLG